MPTRRMSRPVTTGRTASAASANPAAAARSGPRGGRAEPLAAVADDRRAHRQERIGRPPDERPAGPHPMTARGHPQQVAGEDGRDETGGQGQRIGQGIGQDRDADHDDDQPEDRGARVPGGPGDDGPDDDRERDPREGRVHGTRLMGWSKPAPGMSASGGSRTCRAASSAARRGR